MREDQDLTALLGSRICHDLISPLGAIANGVELLQMSGAAASPEVALIAESVANANARIRFFRVAYGMASAEQRVGRPEIVSVLTDVTQGSRLSFDWTVPGDVPRIEVKLAFLAMQCCETAMPYGGKITFARDGSKWRIKAAAAKLKVDPDLWASLRQMAILADLSSAQLQFALLVQLLHDQGRKLSLDLSAVDIVLEF
jgi:histidine phosphotransferase ChpT